MKHLSRLAALALVLASVSCTHGGNPLSRHKVVFDERRMLADGESILLPMDSGKYAVDVSATGDAVSVEWRGATCPGSAETRSFNTTCRLPAEAQLLIRNPRETGAGVPSSVAVRVVKLAP